MMSNNENQFTKGRITSYCNGIKYVVEQVMKLVDVSIRGDAKYESAWKAKISDGEHYIPFRIGFPTDYVPDGLNNNIKNNFQEKIYKAIIQALFYERVPNENITNNKITIDIDLREKEKSDNLLRAYVEFSPSIQFGYTEDKDFESHLLQRAKLEILKKLLIKRIEGVSKDDLEKDIFFDKNIIRAALENLKEEKYRPLIKTDGDRIIITDEGETAINQISTEIKSQQQPKVPIGFQPPS